MFLFFTVIVFSLLKTDALPTPQLTETQFRSGARSLENLNDVLMISGYSQVRKQGGRAFQQPINYPTLKVKSPNQLNVESISKVKLSLADPVFKNKNFQAIAEEINKIHNLDSQQKEEESFLISKEVNEDAKNMSQEETKLLETIEIAQTDETEVLELKQKQINDNEKFDTNENLYENQEGSGLNQQIEELNLDQTDGEITSQIPLLDFGDIQEV